MELARVQHTDIKDHLMVGLTASLLLHVLLLIYFSLASVNSGARKVAPISIRLAEPPPETSRPKQQIVTPPDAPEAEKPPEDTSKLSDKNFRVKKEQIKRGIDPNAGATLGKDGPAQPQKKVEAVKPEPAAKKVAPPEPKAKAKPKKSSKKLKTLTLDTETLIAKYSSEDAAKEQTAENTGAGAPASRPFSRPSGSGAAFIGMRGAPDYLPSLPDGDLTLLNAKADRFAVFVRRVATRVFGQIRASGWEMLHFRDIQRISDYSTIRATLSPEGDLLGITLLGPSGSVRFDEVLANAAKRGARDPNPPPGAAAPDGNIHFIFRARTWSRGAPGRGGYTERRWLLLATGLE